MTLSLHHERIEKCQKSDVVIRSLYCLITLRQYTRVFVECTLYQQYTHPVTDIFRIRIIFTQLTVVIATISTITTIDGTIIRIGTGRTTVILALTTRPVITLTRRITTPIVHGATRGTRTTTTGGPDIGIRTITITILTGGVDEIPTGLVHGRITDLGTLDIGIITDEHACGSVASTGDDPSLMTSL